MTVEKEILLNEAYQNLIRVSLTETGPLTDGIEEFISDDFMGYGTASDERVLSIADYRIMLMRQREQAAGIEMDFHLTPVFRRIAADENAAVFVDDIVILMTAGEEKHQLFFRISMVFEYTGNKWKAIHFHGSKPGENEAEKDTWHLDEARTRNAQLEKLVAEKTADLALKNRELEIEAALERVRARAMGMHNSDELKELIGTVFTELTKLDLVLARCLIMIYEPGNKSSWWWMANSEAQHEPIGLFVQYHEHPPYLAYLKAWNERQIRWQYELHGQIKKDWDDYLFVETGLSQLPDFVIGGMMAPQRVWLSSSFNNFGNLTLATLEPLPDEHFDILLRFAKVFDLTYTRFNDLQKAEAQAKEAQIETALEKVRSRSLAMHHSDELKEVISEVLHKLQELGITMENRSAIICVYEEGVKEFTQWVASPEHSSAIGVQTTYFDSEIHNDIWNARTNGTDFYAKSYSAEEKNAMFQYFFAHTDLRFIPEQEKKWLLERGYYELAIAFEKHSAVMIANFTADLLDSGVHNILKRFAKVFEQAYIRFLDLQTAEARAREAQIESALERVRSRAMAMQNSEDVATATAVMFQELYKLGIETMRCGILIIHENKTMEVWNSYADKNGEIRKVAGLLDMNIHPLLQQAFTAWQNKDENLQYKLEGEDLKDYYAAIARSSTYRLPEYNEPLDTHYCNLYLFDEGSMYTFTRLPHNAETQAVMKKFTAVFSLTFRRYQDLKKAEAQAREAQVEAALERVRSHSMAMHKSNDLLGVINILSDQLLQLGFKIHSANFNTTYREKDWNLWLCNPGTPMYPDQIHIPYFDHPFFNRTLESLAKGSDFNTFIFSKEEKDAFLDHLYSKTLAKNAPEERKKGNYSKPGFAWSVVYLKNTSVTIANYDAEPYTEEQNAILRRFGNAFEQSYTRFLDLQKAEAQTREAQIETSLERVRGKAMAMHSSDDLAETIKVFYHEIELLSVTPRRCGVGLLDKETQIAELSTMNTTEEGNSIEVIGKIKLAGHPVLKAIYDNWLTQQEYHPVLKGKEITAYYQQMRPQVAFPEYPHDVIQYGYFFFFNEGGVYAWTDKELAEEELKIYRRFTSVLSLTYKRYKDLKDAEARTQIAIKEASLDRVRAEIASMRTAEDLQRITPLIWRELTTLGVPFFRCGVFIVDDGKQKIHFYLSAPDGKPLAALELDMDGTAVTKNATAHWRKQKVYLTHWSKEEFIQFANGLVSQGQVQNVNTYQGGEEAPECLTLQFVPFAQGMMYVGSAEELSVAQIELVQALADAFSTAYARYEDFIRLEAAKQQVESTLKDLRATQTQLIQSEKMASLGELTAGIAHEIQNPLNFVNNFSEVSTELVDEMNDELVKGNTNEAQQIAADLKQNLEKITHHGKRAGDIVKGMLQHSRSGSGQKEPTDINALADEYLRLAYHGLRAKDKSFNATMVTDFDPTVGKINMIPQDIGRVVLNLITNAFYAVAEKKKQTSAGYEPAVTVSTKRIPLPGGPQGVEIHVSDNGNGIPQKNLDKIFQPFFTTKPTGQGTGLGLSLSYDIVKGHDGELTVETKQGEGTTFTIHLPNHSS
jgi:signal transduction histidine kinase